MKEKVNLMTKQTDKTVIRIAKEVGIPTWIDDRDRERVYCQHCGDYLTVKTKEDKQKHRYYCETCGKDIRKSQAGKDIYIITDEQRKKEYFDIHMPPPRSDE